MKKSSIIRYWMAPIYLAILVIFLWASVSKGGFWEMNILGLSMPLLFIFIHILPPIILAMPLLMALEPVIISGFLLKKQYRAGDLQNWKIRAYFSGLTAISYYVFVVASYFCEGKMCDGLFYLSSFPGGLLVAPILDYSSEFAQPFLLMILNTTLLFILAWLFLERKAKKELTAPKISKSKVRKKRRPTL